MEERSLPKLRQIRQSPDLCTSLPICRTLEKMKLLTEIASQATSVSPRQQNKRREVSSTLIPHNIASTSQPIYSPMRPLLELSPQALIDDANFHATITTAAWRNKPSWVAVVTKDRTIDPYLERWYAARKAPCDRGSGCRLPSLQSRPEEVAALIEQTPRHAQDQ